MPSIPVVPAASYMSKGLLPILEHVTKKILQLEFVEMHELMVETWLRDEDLQNTRNTQLLPQWRTALVTDILQ